MAKEFVSRGFVGKRPQPDVAGRLPPGQHLTRDFPVLSAGPTPHLAMEHWSFAIEGLVTRPLQWTWDGFLRLNSQTFVADIHCVTKWSKFDTHWEGVSIDTLFEQALPTPEARFVTAHCEGGYSTNVPIADLTGGKAFVAHRYEGAPLAAEHGGPARLVIPHLYFWKSAKWIRRLELMAHDRKGFWERRGYHSYGDPWREQRYSGFDGADGSER